MSFEGPGGAQTHTEVGPSLLEVLAAAGVKPTLNTWVAAVGDDNYVATVTPAEQIVGGRPLQLSLSEDGVTLAQPRKHQCGSPPCSSRRWRSLWSGYFTSASVRALIPARFPARPASR